MVYATPGNARRNSVTDRIEGAVRRHSLVDEEGDELSEEEHDDDDEPAGG